MGTPVGQGTPHLAGYLLSCLRAADCMPCEAMRDRSDVGPIAAGFCSLKVLGSANITACDDLTFSNTPTTC